jgi:hypothetical protein
VHSAKNDNTSSCTTQHHNLNDDFFKTVIKPSLENLDHALQNYPGQAKKAVGTLLFTLIMVTSL